MFYKNIIKRLLDIVVALAGLPILLFFCALAAPIIHLEDGGPVFYCANRIGRHGKLFTMYKFRSMKVNAPDIRLKDGSTYNGDNDPRVSRIGHFLRRTSVDELPQLINILKGEMSLIGPRPDPPDWLLRYPKEVKVFLTARPGITGFNQAYYRNLADSGEKMQNDVYYALHCSFRLDVRIFFKTIAMVFLQKNTTRCNTEIWVEAGQTLQADIIAGKGKESNGTQARS